MMGEVDALVDAVVSRWEEHSLYAETTEEDRRIAERGYAEYYRVCGVPYPGAKFYPSPSAAIMALAEHANHPDMDLEDVADALWPLGAGGRTAPAWPALAELSSEEEHEVPLQAVIDQARCGRWWPMPDGVWASDNPVEVHVDDDGELHNETGPSVRWSDGVEMYHIHGYIMPRYIILDHSTITLEMIEGEGNAEYARILRELYGTSRYLSDIGAEVLDMDVVPTDLLSPAESSTIQRALMRDREGSVFLVSSDGSTERVYCMEVLPFTRTCRQAYDQLRGWSPGDFGKTIVTVIQS